MLNIKFDKCSHEWISLSFKYLSTNPLVLRLTQKAASPFFTGILMPVLAKAVAPPAATSSR